MTPPNPKSIKTAATAAPGHSRRMGSSGQAKAPPLGCNGFHGAFASRSTTWSAPFTSLPDQYARVREAISTCIARVREAVTTLSDQYACAREDDALLPRRPT